MEQYPEPESLLSTIFALLTPPIAIIVLAVLLFIGGTIGSHFFPSADAAHLPGGHDLTLSEGGGKQERFTDPRLQLTRAEQLAIMQGCVDDSKTFKTGAAGKNEEAIIRGRLAVVLFEYRTFMRLR